MKDFKLSLAVLALLQTSSAINIKSSPDVFGPNGENYDNQSADYDLSQIGIDI